MGGGVMNKKSEQMYEIKERMRQVMRDLGVFTDEKTFAKDFLGFRQDCSDWGMEIQGWSYNDMTNWTVRALGIRPEPEGFNPMERGYTRDFMNSQKPNSD